MRRTLQQSEKWRVYDTDNIVLIANARRSGVALGRLGAGGRGAGAGAAHCDAAGARAWIEE